MISMGDVYSNAKMRLQLALDMAMATNTPIIPASKRRVGAGRTTARRTLTSTPLLDSPVCKAFLQHQGTGIQGLRREKPRFEV